MSNNGLPVITLKKLSHTYLTGTSLEVRSLHEVDLEVCLGETVGIIGPSGSGKSTLLYHLNGLFRPQSGEVIIFNVPLSDPEADFKDIRRRVGLVFQNPEKQLFERYVGDDIAFGPRNLQLSTIEVREKVREAMNLVGLPFSFKDRLITRLSVGEKRRVAIAGVLAMDPEVLVLDEPVASLDPEGRQDLFHIIDLWRSKKNRAVVIVSHHMEDIVELSDRIYVMTEGEILISGTPERVFSHSGLLMEHGLTLPVTVQLIHRLRAHGYDFRSSFFSMDDFVKEIEVLSNVKKG
ncbi:MAG: energy-coupling factor transporter ATPase [Spirochaetota bacterium]|nr:MAG: energy-coupling factor transporter ATPase [Spirochaetota bacterium]